ncbi:MAG: hypothetical protein EBY74_03190 [Actinobacteria bacterium]|nr:hypothetical protein [Actinomycetota bacterium]
MELAMGSFNRQVALPTLHQKGSLIAPIFYEVLGVEVIEIAIDTDQFGTFAGDIERSRSPLDSAKAKARLALEVSGLDAAVASEGSIGPDFEIPFVTSDVETLVYLDEKEGVEIDESFKSFDILALSHTFEGTHGLEEFLVKADFPRHQLIVKCMGPEGLLVEKGIKERAHLEYVIKRFQDLKTGDEITIESDLRAHASPTRQKNIKAVAEILAQRIASRCPACNKSGFGRRSWKRGLFCSDCGGFNEEAIHSEYLNCPSCEYRHEGKVINASIEARHCIFCNP